MDAEGRGDIDQCDRVPWRGGSSGAWRSAVSDYAVIEAGLVDQILTQWASGKSAKAVISLRALRSIAARRGIAARARP